MVARNVFVDRIPDAAVVIDLEENLRMIPVDHLKADSVHSERVFQGQETANRDLLPDRMLERERDELAVLFGHDMLLPDLKLRQPVEDVRRCLPISCIALDFHFPDTPALFMRVGRPVS
jgi:hypothetical protein